MGLFLGREGKHACHFPVSGAFMLGIADLATAQDRPDPATLVGLKAVFLEVYADRGLESPCGLLQRAGSRQAVLLSPATKTGSPVRTSVCYIAT